MYDVGVVMDCIGFVGLFLVDEVLVEVEFLEFGDFGGEFLLMVFFYFLYIECMEIMYERGWVEFCYDDVCDFSW